MFTAFVVLIALVGSSIGANIIKPPARVVGGTLAKNGEAPYQASYRFLDHLQCGGVIIDKRWILTAGHCAIGTGTNGLTINVGTNRLDERGVEYNVSRIIQHEEYNEESNINDIALIKVEWDIEFTSVVQPIALEEGFVGSGANVTLTGWGATSFPGSSPNDLQIIQLSTISLEECTQRLESSPIFDTEICTFTKAGEGACFGDSGGPLVLGNKLVGIVSWGKPCAKGYPDVYTRVSSFIKWIRKHQETS